MNVTGILKSIFSLVFSTLFLLQLPTSSVFAVALNIVDSGEYAVAKGNIHYDSEVPHSESREMSDPSLIKKTDVIDAEVGVVFGFRYKITGIPIGEKVEMLYRVKHPEIQKDFSELSFNGYDQVRRETTGNIIDYMYEITYPWEIAEGEWVFQVIYDNQPLLEKTFIIRRKNVDG